MQKRRIKSFISALHEFPRIDDSPLPLNELDELIDKEMENYSRFSKCPLFVLLAIRNKFLRAKYNDTLDFAKFLKYASEVSDGKD